MAGVLSFRRVNVIVFGGFLVLALIVAAVSNYYFQTFTPVLVLGQLGDLRPDGHIIELEAWRDCTQIRQVFAVGFGIFPLRVLAREVRAVSVDVYCT